MGLLLEKHREKKRESSAPPHLSVYPLPSKSQRYYDYLFVGQGARALAFEPGFAREIVQTDINNFYDLHVLDLVSRRANAVRSWLAQYTAVVCMPSVFCCEPQRALRFRDSGRLRAGSSTCEEFSYYFCVELPYQVDVVGRLHTVVVMLMLAAFHRIGVHILWPVSATCACKFEDLFEFDLQRLPVRSVPFLRVTSDPKDSVWQHNSKDSRWCRGHIHASCLVDSGVTHLLEIYEKKYQKDHRVIPYAACIRRELNADRRKLYWNWLIVKNSLAVISQQYINQYMPSRKTHIVLENFGVADVDVS